MRDAVLGATNLTPPEYHWPLKMQFDVFISLCAPRRGRRSLRSAGGRGHQGAGLRPTTLLLEYLRGGAAEIMVRPRGLELANVIFGKSLKCWANYLGSPPNIVGPETFRPRPATKIVEVSSAGSVSLGPATHCCLPPAKTCSAAMAAAMWVDNLPWLRDGPSNQ
jgi:hypothetical protein